jgi:short subunit dehydrogenase-like uncharacterized protein
MEMSSSPKQFDIVVYGATGFTGQLVAEYFASRYRDDKALRWAMAGRSLDKLTSVRDAIGAAPDTPLVVADASDPASLKAMANAAKSVISTVGPYQLYGTELVAACAEAGADYLDLCGEPIWMRQMIDRYEATAKSSGARILFPAVLTRCRSSSAFCSSRTRRKRRSARRPRGSRAACATCAARFPAALRRARGRRSRLSPRI